MKEFLGLVVFPLVLMSPLIYGAYRVQRRSRTHRPLTIGVLCGLASLPWCAVGAFFLPMPIWTGALLLCGGAIVVSAITAYVTPFRKEGFS